jgi:hypothetical protein
MNRARPMAALAAASALAVSLLAGIGPARAATTPGSTYFPLAPTRVLDTRDGTGAPAGPLGPGAALDLTVVGTRGVPASGVTAVVLNVTATDATAQHSYLTVHPAGSIRPVASNLNFSAGTTSTNLVTVAVPTAGDKAGKVTIYNNVGSVSVVADLNGWYSANGSSVGTTYNPLPPARVLDTRSGVGSDISLIFPGQTIDVQVTGRGGVPETGVSAVVLNVTAVHESGPESFLTVYPSGTDRPLASNLNFLNRRAVPNLVIARLGAGGKISMYNNLGLANFVADVQGWYTSVGTTTGATYFPVSPTRALDTRNGTGTGISGRRVGPGETVDFTPLDVTTPGGLAGVVMNVTAVDHSGPDSFLTVFPTPDVITAHSAPYVDPETGIARPVSPPPSNGRPLASNLNVIDGQTIPNLVIVPFGANRQVSIYNDAGSVDVVADVQGWFLTNGG